MAGGGVVRFREIGKIFNQNDFASMGGVTVPPLILIAPKDLKETLKG